MGAEVFEGKVPGLTGQDLLDAVGGVGSDNLAIAVIATSEARIKKGSLVEMST